MKHSASSAMIGSKVSKSFLATNEKKIGKKTVKISRIAFGFPLACFLPQFYQNWIDEICLFKQIRVSQEWIKSKWKVWIHSEYKNVLLNFEVRLKQTWP